MAVSNSKPQLEEAWVAVQFQFIGLTADSEGGIPEAARTVRDAAYAAVEAEYRGLSSIYRGDSAVEVPVYDICANEEDVQESQGGLVVAISFVSGLDFTGEAIAELKTLCAEKFAEAAAACGVNCTFAGIEGWRRLTYLEHAVIEAARTRP